MPILLGFVRKAILDCLKIDTWETQGACPAGYVVCYPEPSRARPSSLSDYGHESGHF